VRAIHDEAERRAWPKLYYFPIDEPSNNKTENRYLFAENVLDFVHEVPGCRTADGRRQRRSALGRPGGRADLRLRELQSQEGPPSWQGHPFWFYENGMFYGHSTLASRSLTGFEFLRSGAEVATAWGFDSTTANPYNDFDGGHRDWNVMFPGVEAPTPTIYWELCREGVDDCRYVATLQRQILLAPGSVAKPKPHGRPNACWSRSLIPRRSRSNSRLPSTDAGGASPAESWGSSVTEHRHCHSRPSSQTRRHGGTPARI
jgi:hypothetical protein